MKMIAVIFAKKSERFPGKHMHLIGNIRLIDHVAKKLQESDLFEKVVIFTKDTEIKSRFAEIVVDQSNGTLLRSIVEAINLFGDIFAFAGDMPLIDVRVIRKMLEKFEGRALCPVLADGHLEPLHAIYTETVKESMLDYSNSGRKSIQGFIRSSQFEFIEIGDDRSFFNLNYPEDVEYARKMLGGDKPA